MSDTKLERKKHAIELENAHKDNGNCESADLTGAIKCHTRTQERRYTRSNGIFTANRVADIACAAGPSSYSYWERQLAVSQKWPILIAGDLK